MEACTVRESRDTERNDLRSLGSIWKISYEVLLGDNLTDNSNKKCHITAANLNTNTNKESMDLSTKSTVPGWGYANRLLMCGSSSNNVSFQAATDLNDYEQSSNQVWWHPGGFQNSASFPNGETGNSVGRGNLSSNFTEYFHSSNHLDERGQHRHSLHVTDTQCHSYSDSNGCWFQPISMQTHIKEPVNFGSSKLSQQGPLPWNTLQSERRLIAVPIPSASVDPPSIIPPNNNTVGIEKGLDESTQLSENKNAFTVSLPGGKPLFTIPLVISTSPGAHQTPSPSPKKSRSKPRTVVYRPQSYREKSVKSAFAPVGKKGRASANPKNDPLALLRRQGNPEEDAELGGWQSPITDVPARKQRRTKKSPKPSSIRRLPQPTQRSPVSAKNRLRSKKMAEEDTASKGNSHIVPIHTSEMVKKGLKTRKGSEVKKSTGSALLSGTKERVHVEKARHVLNLSDESDANFGEDDEEEGRQDTESESGVEEREPNLHQQSNLDMPDIFDLFPSTEASKSNTSNGLKSDDDDEHEIGLKDSRVDKCVEMNVGGQQRLQSADKLATNVNEMSNPAKHQDQSPPFFPSGSSSSSEDDASENTAPLNLQSNVIRLKSRRPGIHWKKAARNFSVEEDISLSSIRNHTNDFHCGGSGDIGSTLEENNEVMFRDDHSESELRDTCIDYNGTMADSAACNEKFNSHTPPLNNELYSLYGNTNTNFGRPASEIRSKTIPQETANERNEWGNGRISRNSSGSDNFDLRSDKLYDLTPSLPFLPLDSAPSRIQEKRHHFNRGPYDIQLKPLLQQKNSYHDISLSVAPAHLQRLKHMSVSNSFDVAHPIYNSDSKLGPFAHLQFLSDATSLPPNPSHNPFGYEPVEQTLRLQPDGSYIPTPIFTCPEETRTENGVKNSSDSNETYTLHLCDYPTGITETPVDLPNLRQVASSIVTRREEPPQKGRVTQIDKMGNKIVRRIAHASATKAPPLLFQMRNEDSSSDELSTDTTLRINGQRRPLCSKIKLHNSNRMKVCNESVPQVRKRGRPIGSKSKNIHQARQSNRLGKTLKKFASTVGRRVPKIQQRLLNDINKLYVLGRPTQNNSKSGLQSRTTVGLKAVHLSIPGPFERRVRTRCKGPANSAELSGLLGESRPHIIQDKCSKNTCPCPPTKKDGGNKRTASPMSQDLPESISLTTNFPLLSKDNDDADILSLHEDMSLDDLLNDSD